MGSRLEIIKEMLYKRTQMDNLVHEEPLTDRGWQSKRFGFEAPFYPFVLTHIRCSALNYLLI